MDYDEDILIFATRYALGRQTFAVQTVIDEIATVMYNLSFRARRALLVDIGRYVCQADKSDFTVKDWVTCFMQIESLLDDGDRNWLYSCDGGGLRPGAIYEIAKERLVK